MQLCWKKKVKRREICPNFNARGGGEAKMSCELDKCSVPQNLKEVERTFPEFALINLYIQILGMQDWSHHITLQRKQFYIGEHDTEAQLVTNFGKGFLGVWPVRTIWSTRSIGFVFKRCHEDLSGQLQSHCQTCYQTWNRRNAIW